MPRKANKPRMKKATRRVRRAIKKKARQRKGVPNYPYN